MRQLILLRHATAQDGHGKADFDRRLTEPGRVDAKRMGSWLVARGLCPDHAVSSPAPRALKTAHLACAQFGPPAPLVRTDAGLYGCEAPALLRKLAALPPASRCVLVVGHNPGLEQVALHLTGDEDLAARGLPTAGAVVAELPDDWNDLGARVASSWAVADPAGLA
ncbi:MAG: histidine phosphatase family protein [Candidatus Thermoplasmatota archaeon]